MATYDNYLEWKGWSEFGIYSRAESKLFEKEFRNIELKGKNVLDIGFGSGSFMMWASDTGANAEGVELQESLVCRARDAGFVVYNSLDEIKNKSYDVIALFDVLEHLDREALPHFFSTIIKILNEGGLIFVRIPNCQSFLGLINQFGDMTHVNMLSGPMILQLGSQLGLDIVVYRDACTKNDSKYFFKRMMHPLRLYIKNIILTIFKVLLMIGSHPYSENIVIILKNKSKIYQIHT
jgi:SAM-dependent methyltransferase